MKNFDLGRKGLVSILALLIGVGAEKYGGGISTNLLALLISIVTLFTGANVMSQKIGGGSSILPVPEKEDSPDVESVPSEDLTSEIATLRKYITDLDNVCGRQFQDYNKQHEEAMKLLKAQGNSIAGLTNILNKGAQRGPEKQSSTLPSKRVCVVFEEVAHPDSSEMLFLKVFLEPDNRPLDEKWAVCDDPTLAEIWAGETMELITNYLQKEMMLDEHGEFAISVPQEDRNELVGDQMSQESLSGGPQEKSEYLKKFSQIAGLQLVGDTILVEKLPLIESKTESGIIIPNAKQGSYKQTYNDDVIEFAVVLMVGPGDVDSEGNHLSMTTKPGDIIALPPNVQWYSQFGNLKGYKMGTIGRMRDSYVMMCFSDYNKAMEALNA